MATSIKKINGKEYLYYHYYENGRKKDVYCGPASKLESIDKSKMCEMEDLARQKQIIMDKMALLKKQIKSNHYT